MQLLCEPRHRWRAYAHWLVGHKIAIEHVFKIGHNVIIHLMPCAKLAVVEAHTVVEQQFYGRGYDGVAMVVAAIVDFLVYPTHAVDDGFTLFF